MTSAPSRRQRSNGNSLAWAILLPLLLLYSSCDLFTKVQPATDPGRDKEVLDPIQGRRVYDPETGTYVIVKTAPTEKMDTIAWREVPMTASPPITSTGVYFDSEAPPAISQPPVTDPNTGSRLLESYNVVFALPFQTDRFSASQGQVPANSAWALNFYSGAKMALDELQAEGARFRVSVLDTKATDAGMSELIRRNPDFSSAHLIIGPYRRDNVRLAIEAAVKNQSVLVSPINADENLAVNNPNYIQVNPTLSTHSEAILKEVLRTHRPDQVVLVCRARDVEVQRLRYFQDAYRQMMQQAFSRDTASLREFIIPDEGDNVGSLRINTQQLIQNRDTIAFIVPSWSSEVFINALLQQIDGVRAPYSEFTVYGMPQWIEYERIDYNLYQNLKLHLSSSYYVNREEWTVQDFQRLYFNRFGLMPAQESYLGYDITLYYCRMLRKYGTRFQYSLREDPGQGLHTRFEVQAVPVQGSANREFPQVKQFENKYLNILKFEDFRFMKVN